jgi:uncharacterized protein (TIGR03086 family)
VPVLDALDVATAEFAQRLALVGADQWAAPTPCDDWDVRSLVAHVVGGNRFTALVLGGVAAGAALQDVLAHPLLGDDALGAFRLTAEDQRRGFRAMRPDVVVDHVVGPIDVRRFLAFRVFDITIHAWDLAAAIGADTRLDGDLVDVVLAVIDAEAPGDDFGIVPVGRAGAGDEPLAILLDHAGRASR